MITLKKLSTLKEDTRMRKVLRILEEIGRGESFSPEYLEGICEAIIQSGEARVTSQTRTLALRFSQKAASGKIDSFACSDLAFALASDMGSSFGDWDFTDENALLDASKRSLLPISLLLDRIRSPFNVGSMFRTSESFGVSEILLTTPCAPVEHPRTQRSAAGATAVVPYRSGESSEIMEMVGDRPLFALELGGTDIHSFKFPREGVMIVGSEELGVSPELLSLARESYGIVSIPLFGAKGSLNVSTACAIALHEWVSRLRA